MQGWRIGVIGFGAIGRDVVDLLAARRSDARFIVLRRSPGPLDAPGMKSVVALDEMIAERPDVVVEAAGHHALETCVPVLLRRGISVIAASVGPLVQETETGLFWDDLVAAAQEGGARLVLPAGAIGGLDYIRAAALSPNLRIAYTSRKPPDAWRDELDKRGVDPAALRGEIVLFEGSVAEAAALYPRNLNVAATLALACGEPRRVRVRVVVDAAARGNTHEIECESAAGTARFEFVNAPAPSNPKTSMLTALSLVHCVEDFLNCSPGSN